MTVFEVKALVKNLRNLRNLRINKEEQSGFRIESGMTGSELTSEVLY